MPITSLAVFALAALIQARPPLKLVKEFTLDAASGVSFGTLQNIDIGPDGGIAVVDQGNGVIYRFTAAGKLRDSLSHKGQGPGEFMTAAGLGIGPAGEVALVDIRTRRFTQWNADGSLKGSAQVQGGMPIDLYWRGAAPVVGILNFGPGIQSQARFVAAGTGDISYSGTVVAAYPDPPREEYPTAVSCGMCRRAATPDGKLLAAAPDTFYRISEVNADGKALRTWKRTDIGAGERTKEEADALQARIAAGPGGGQRPPPGLPVPNLKYRPRVQGIGIDGTGKLIALVSNAGSTSPVIDVFAGDGKFLGTIKPAEELKALVVRGSRVVALGESKDGEHVLHVYRIE